jgi:hypothetical protein
MILYVAKPDDKGKLFIKKAFELTSKYSIIRISKWRTGQKI